MWASCLSDVEKNHWRRSWTSQKRGRLVLALLVHFSPFLLLSCIPYLGFGVLKCGFAWWLMRKGEGDKPHCSYPLSKLLKEANRETGQGQKEKRQKKKKELQRMMDGLWLVTRHVAVASCFTFYGMSCFWCSSLQLPQSSTLRARVHVSPIHHSFRFQWNPNGTRHNPNTRVHWTYTYSVHPITLCGGIRHFNPFCDYPLLYFFSH